MRVAMGEVVDISKDFTTYDLSLSQKISVIWQSLTADSKILNKKKNAEKEKELQRRNEIYDSLKDGLLASLALHLQENRTLIKYNQEALELQLAIDRSYLSILEQVLRSHEFNVYEINFLELDLDLINSFGNEVPVIISFRQKEV